MERLLDEIQEDAASLKFSCAASSTGSTIPGLGMVSGRVIKAVGSLALRGVEVVNIQTRLIWMAIQLRKGIDHIPKTFYEDLMELQRINLYPKRVRRQAWDLIFLLLEQRRSDFIAETLSRWRSVEVRLFLSQLAACRMSEWTLDVAKVGSGGKSKGSDPCLRARLDHKDHQGRMTDGFCDLVLAIFMKDRSTLHSALDNELAWDCVLLFLEKRRFQGIISAAITWSDACRRLFLRQLAASMLRSWTSLPEYRQSSLDDIDLSFPCHPDKPSDTERAGCLTECFRELIYETLMKYPAELLKAFNVDEFSALQSCNTSDPKSEPAPKCTVLYFLQTLRHHPPAEAPLLHNWMLPLRAITFIKFLTVIDKPHDRVVDEPHVRVVVTCLVDVLREAAEDGEGLQPLLCFAIHLCSESPLAAHIASEIGLLDVLDIVWTRNQIGASQDILTGYTIIALQLCGSTQHASQHTAISGWSAYANSITVIRELHGVLATTSQHTIHRYIQAQWLTLFRLLTSMTRCESDSLESHSNPWALLLSDAIFSQNGSLESTLAWSATQVIFSCISQSSKYWPPLIDALMATPVNDLHTILSYIIKFFIRTPGSHPIVSEHTQTALNSMFQNASSYGLTIVNPIDRFLEFINIASTSSNAFNFALYCAGAYEFISEVHSGFYDFIGRDTEETDSDSIGSTASQKRKRLAVCVEVQQRLVSHGVVPAADLGRAPIVSPVVALHRDHVAYGPIPFTTV